MFILYFQCIFSINNFNRINVSTTIYISQKKKRKNNFTKRNISHVRAIVFKKEKKEKNSSRVKMKHRRRAVNARLSNLHLGKSRKNNWWRKRTDVSSSRLLCTRARLILENHANCTSISTGGTVAKLFSDPIGGLGRVCARYNTCNDSALFPSPPISDAPLHTVARALLGFCY